MLLREDLLKRRHDQRRRRQARARQRPRARPGRGLVARSSASTPRFRSLPAPAAAGARCGSAPACSRSSTGRASSRSSATSRPRGCKMGFGRLAKLHPAQIADLVEAASHEEGEEIIDAVAADREFEADVFEELDPEHQVEFLSERSDERGREDPRRDGGRRRRRPDRRARPGAARAGAEAAPLAHAAQGAHAARLQPGDRGRADEPRLRLARRHAHGRRRARASCAAPSSPRRRSRPSSPSTARAAERGRLGRGAAASRSPTTLLADAASPPPLVLETDDELSEIAMRMADYDLTIAPVVDERGGAARDRLGRRPARDDDPRGLAPPGRRARQRVGANARCADSSGEVEVEPAQGEEDRLAEARVGLDHVEQHLDRRLRPGSRASAAAATRRPRARPRRRRSATRAIGVGGELDEAVALGPLVGRRGAGSSVRGQVEIVPSSGPTVATWGSVKIVAGTARWSARAARPAMS